MLRVIDDFAIEMTNTPYAAAIDVTFSLMLIFHADADTTFTPP